MRILDTVTSAILTALLATADVMLNGAKLRLIMDDFEEEDIEEEADIVDPTFTGYAEAVLSGPTVGVDAEGKSYVQWTAVEFTPTNAVNLPQGIFGCAIVDDADNLLMVSKFEDAANLLFADQILTVLPKFRIGDETGNNVIATVE